jgi:hypothetical protein
MLDNYEHIDLVGFHSYRIVYIGIFGDPGEDCKSMIINGRGERIRTSDPLVPNQVLYQAEPLPELVFGWTFTAERLLAGPLSLPRELPQSVSEGRRDRGARQWCFPLHCEGAHP